MKQEFSLITMSKRSLGRKLVTLLLLPLLGGCFGYEFANLSTCDRPITFTVPCVKNDVNGLFADQLIRQLGVSGKFKYTRYNPQIELVLNIKSNETEHVGYVYDRPPLGGELIKRLMPNEGNRTAIVEVVVKDARKNKCLMGPFYVDATAHYSFVNFDNIDGLEFIDQNGQRQSVLTYSQGQVGAEEDAKSVSQSVVFRKLAEKIVNGLSQIDRI